MYNSQPFNPLQMYTMKFIVKLFPEITIKSKPVRKRFIQRLQSNLQVTLKRINNDIKVRGLWDRIEVELPSDDAELRSQAIELMMCTPGIQHILEVDQYPLGSFEDVFQITKRVYAEQLKDKTFVVRVKRGAGILSHPPSLSVISVEGCVNIVRPVASICIILR